MDDKPLTMVSNEEEAKQSIATNEKDEEDIEALVEPPDWLPDGWIMEVYRAEDGTTNRYYTSPISDCTFSKKSDVLEYLFSQADERILEIKECGVESTLQKEREWLPKGWVMEIRVGGEKMDKMYKFYVCQKTGVRLLSKQDVILYINGQIVSQYDTNGQCDASSKDNLLAIVDFHPIGLPEGWVKELAFRKTKEGLTRKDPYYTDPTSSYTVRTLKSALYLVETGNVPKHAFIQMISVHDLYYFDKSTDLHESLRSRRIINETPHQKASRSSRGKLQIEYDQDKKDAQDGDTSSGSNSPYELEEENIIRKKAKGKEVTSSRIISHSRTRPPKHQD